ncbi:hypothetical protein A2V82_05955 [candidate division KSB1 bacterium RBG_16_48_16]|nr:MAG: hypothetical protein A2V82_05955 [candidate division KSB1 bacterium RBG_16_48_16]
MKKEKTTLLFLLSLFIAPPAFCGLQEESQPATTNGQKPTLAVIGMANQVEDENWRDARVGLGLRNVLAELFFDTGRFTLIEEKPDIRRRLDKFSQGLWQLGNNADFERIIERIGVLDADFIAYGKVTYFGKPKTKLSFGPMHIQRNAVVIEVDVTLMDLKSGKAYRQEGDGLSRTVVGSALFQFREDHVELDQTNVGNAVREALEEAVNKIVKENFE